MIEFLGFDHLILQYVTGLSIVFGGVSICYLKLTMARRFEKKFHNVRPNSFTAKTQSYKAARFINYLRMVAFYNQYKTNPNNQLYTLYKGYNFRANVNGLELLFVKIFWITAYSGILSILMSSAINSILQTAQQKGILPWLVHMSGFVALWLYVLISIFGCFILVISHIKLNLSSGDGAAPSLLLKHFSVNKILIFSVMIGATFAMINILLYYCNFGHF